MELFEFEQEMAENVAKDIEVNIFTIGPHRQESLITHGQHSTLDLTTYRTGMLSFECPDINCKDPASGIPRRHPLCFESGDFISTYNPKITTLFESFELSVQKNFQKPFLGTRGRLENETCGEYQWKTYGEFFALVKKLTMALIAYTNNTRAKVAISPTTREEWFIIEQACFAAGIVTVPFYDALYGFLICSNAEVEIIFATKDKLDELLEGGYLCDLFRLYLIVCLDDLSPEEFKKYEIAFGKYEGIEFKRFKEFCNSSNAKFTPISPQPEDLVTIFYGVLETKLSRTEGPDSDNFYCIETCTLKGVKIPHSSILACASGLLALGKNGSFVELASSDVYLCHLPFSNIFERVVSAAMISVGASIGFSQGDQINLICDFYNLRPTILASDSHLFNEIYQSYEDNKSIGDCLLETIQLESIREGFGGRVRAIISGSAPLSPEVLNFLRTCFQCQVYEIYGQPETCAFTCLKTEGFYVPAPSCEIKLVNVPEMGYFANDPIRPRGEICARGPSCYTGYYKVIEDYADGYNVPEILDSKGWVHTGDIGEWDSCGRLRIIDKMQNVRRLKQELN